MVLGSIAGWNARGRQTYCGAMEMSIPQWQNVF